MLQSVQVCRVRATGARVHAVRCIFVKLVQEKCRRATHFADIWSMQFYTVELLDRKAAVEAAKVFHEYRFDIVLQQQADSMGNNRCNTNATHTS